MIYKGFEVPRPGIEPGWIAPLVFETSASTDSAIWAWRLSLKTGAKVRLFSELTNLFSLFLSNSFKLPIIFTNHFGVSGLLHKLVANISEKRMMKQIENTCGE